MKSWIYILDEKTGEIERRAVYTLDRKSAIIAFIMQDIKKDFNTWNYPAWIDGMREKHGNYYFDDISGGRIIAAYDI